MVSAYSRSCGMSLTTEVAVAISQPPALQVQELVQMLEHASHQYN